LDHSSYLYFLEIFSSFIPFHFREEEREDFDTSTENKNIEQKDLDPDVVTEDEDDPGSHKRSRRGTCQLTDSRVLSASWLGLDSALFKSAVNSLCS
jgi:hypothetical protein